MNKKRRKHVLKITLLSVSTFLILTVSASFLFLSGWVKNKMISYVEEHSDYHISIGSISFPGLTDIEIESVKLWPKQDKAAFNKQNGYQSDWIVFSANHISVTGIHLKKLLFDKEFVSHKITVRHPDIYAYRDKRYARPGYKYKALPTELIQYLPYTVTISILEIKKGIITYEEMPEDGKEAGKIFFTEVFASAYHISNDSHYIAEQPQMIVEGKGLVLDSAKADIRYTADLTGNDFTMKGIVHTFPATLLNRCLPQLAKSRIKSGTVNYLSFQFHANNDVADGTMDIDYENLSVEILSQGSQESKLKSFVANLFVRNSDPDAENNLLEKDVTGIIHYERKKDRFIFNYWWNAIKSGIISNVLSIEIPDKGKK